MDNPSVIGHIVSVQGFRLKVELLPEAKSPLRATLDGVYVAVAINAYLTFSIGAGQIVVGMITDLEARESYDPADGQELTLQLSKPRRVASVQLLGTIQQIEGAGSFSPGITILPTLDTPAEIGSPSILKAIFEVPPQRNRPEEYPGKDYDFDLPIGNPTGQPANVVKASYNDLFSRPLAIVGNTGSGKSYSVTSLIQRAMAVLKDSGNEPHIFVLDINGEYGRAFSADSQYERRPDRIYLNGKEFGIPIWFFDAQEICAWLGASEQTQEPVLKDWWALAKSGNQVKSEALLSNSYRAAIGKAQAILSILDAGKGTIKKNCCDNFRILKSYVTSTEIDGMNDLRDALQGHFDSLKEGDGRDFSPPLNEAKIRAATQKVIVSLKACISSELSQSTVVAATADSPKYISKSKLVDPTLLDTATPLEDAARIDSYLTTLKLRLTTRLVDPRWYSFLNYEDSSTRLRNFEEWASKFGLGRREGPKVSIIDLSMLSHEVLPYACSVIGRILLETRENLLASHRYKHPWVLVLEEAHNYARPARHDEERGQKLSRLAFERIAKEGRKFGISLIVASQRPSEISETIISQCANFVSHRLQNPADIEHFRQIIPMQARRLLDQVTILASGEAIVFGSAFHVPTRVQFYKPDPSPASQTAAPYHEWKKELKSFPLASVADSWGVSTKIFDWRSRILEQIVLRYRSG